MGQMTSGGQQKGHQVVAKGTLGVPWAPKGGRRVLKKDAKMDPGRHFGSRATTLIPTKFAQTGKHCGPKNTTK